jgi:hypothetical protein
MLFEYPAQKMCPGIGPTGRKIRHRDSAAGPNDQRQSLRQILQKCDGFWYFRVPQRECVSESVAKIRWWKRTFRVNLIFFTALTHPIGICSV